MNESSDEADELKNALAAVPKEILLEAIAEQTSSIQLDDDNSKAKIVQKVTQSFSGPLPPPQVLEQYDQTHPGLANRIVQMAEIEQIHRHNIEKTALTGAVSTESRGQHYALIICLVVIVLSFGLIWEGHAIAGSVFASGTLISLAYLFITGRGSPSKEEGREDEPPATDGS